MIKAKFSPVSHVPIVRYFRYSTFGNVTVYVSDMGEGRTLASVIHLVKSKPNKIFSNAHLFHLPYTYLPHDKMIERDELRNATFFTDMAEMVFNTRFNQHYTVYHGLLNQSNKLGLKFVLNSRNIQMLDIGIREQITSVIFCRFIPKQRLHLVRCRIAYKTVWQKNLETGKEERVMISYLKPTSQCLLKRVGKYFKYYDTVELVKLPKSLPEPPAPDVTKKEQQNES